MQNERRFSRRAGKQEGKATKSLLKTMGSVQRKYSPTNSNKKKRQKPENTNVKERLLCHDGGEGVLKSTYTKKNRKKRVDASINNGITEKNIHRVSKRKD